MGIRLLGSEKKLRKDCPLAVMLMHVLLLIRKCGLIIWFNCNLKVGMTYIVGGKFADLAFKLLKLFQYDTECRSS